MRSHGGVVAANVSPRHDTQSFTRMIRETLSKVCTGTSRRRCVRGDCAHLGGYTCSTEKTPSFLSISAQSIAMFSSYESVATWTEVVDPGKLPAYLSRCFGAYVKSTFLASLQSAKYVAVCRDTGLLLIRLSLLCSEHYSSAHATLQNRHLNFAICPL